MRNTSRRTKGSRFGVAPQDWRGRETGMNSNPVTKSNLPLLLTAKEAADVLLCSDRTITRMCEDGTLKGCRAGNRWRVNRDALLEYAGLATQAAGEVE